MGRIRQEPSPEPLPGENPPMDSRELEEIGTRLFGRVGWPIKVSKLVGKDATTVRRWRTGSPIEPAYAKIIRDYDRQHTTPDSVPWDENTRRPDAEALRALKLVARAQSLGSLGAPVGVRVSDSPEGLSITVRVGGKQPLAAWQSEAGFQGLHEIEEALNAVWQTFNSAG